MDGAAVPGGAPRSHKYQYLIHDRDSIFSKELDKEITAMGVRVLRTPVRAPKANSVCELGGTLRRECLDLFIPFNERHLRFVLTKWIAHFYHSTPNMSLGPGIRSHYVRPRRRALIDIVFLVATRLPRCRSGRTPP
jgi:hypothetical protein